MTNVANAFRRSIFALAALSAVMLASSEGEFFPNVLTVPLAIAAYLVTVHRPKFMLPTLGANLLALLALFMAGGEWARGEMTSDMESAMLVRLVAGTHLLVYLMWIVLFQQKSRKHYWWMFALSLLQVAVGSVLTDSGYYGLLLLAYLFAAIWTLSLFTLHVARQDMKRPLAVVASAELPAARNGGSHTESSNSARQSILQPSRVIWENHARGWHRRPIDLRFVWGACATAVTSLAIAMMFFLLVPRVWIGRMPALRGGTIGSLALSLTGFSEEVRLGSTGQILESTERVLFVRIFDADNNEIGVPDYASRLGYDEPLFRGAVLGTYKDGRWSAGHMGSDQDLPVAEPEAEAEDLIRQEYRLALPKTSFLFAMQPFDYCRVRNSKQGISCRRFSAALLRHADGRKQSLSEYSVFSKPFTPPASGPQNISVRPPVLLHSPWGQGPGATPFRHDFNRMMWQCRNFPNDNGKLSRLKTLAQQVAGFDSTSMTNPSKRDMAKRLEAYLRDSGKFGYSLNSSVINVNDDPVEDFLFNRKVGHCEYFASALALMLRAVDIPSRLVNGFKGGSVNRLTGEFYVEQRHAHAWVEAWIDRRWITLDATPAQARSDSVASLAPAINSWDDLVSMIENQWSASFVSMNIIKQNESFYAPIKRGLTAAWAEVKGEGEGAAGRSGSIGKFLSSPENWFSWQGAVATMFLLSMIAGIVWSIRKLWQRQGDLRLPGHNGRVTEQIRVEFYERFRTLCRSLGLSRGESQTEREFLANVDDSIRTELTTAGLERVPAELVDSFYEVRFGGRLIDGELAHRLDTQLSALEKLTMQLRSRA